MKQKLNLTPTNVEALRSGSLSDPRTPGLYIEVQTGRGRISRIWKYRRRLPGKISFHKATLGSYPAHSIVDAREWAATIPITRDRASASTVESTVILMPDGSSIPMEPPAGAETNGACSDGGSLICTCANSPA